ncbi:uncharacterized protein LOC108871187 [Brassica rapa]|uniref:uncharacterized protein LOC108871187 n=1 Tax=Brassica campestris TaxID=3711 RepID=UPI000872AD42|nr:uncharacterized protein LOC108871187 [Brassica rapa]
MLCSQSFMAVLLPTKNRRWLGIEGFWEKRKDLLTQRSDATEPDTFFWGPPENNSGGFSTKETWKFLRPRAAAKDWSKVVWFKNMVPKHAFNFWVANLDRLPVNERLVQWGLMDIGTCTFCSTDEETRDHLLFSCRFAVEIWDRVKHRLGAPRIFFTSGQAMIGWLVQQRWSPRRRLLSLIVCQATVYHIWRERIDRKHGRPPSTPLAIFNKIDRVTKDILLARRRNKGCTTLLSLWFKYS